LLALGALASGLGYYAYKRKRSTIAYHTRGQGDFDGGNTGLIKRSNDEEMQEKTRPLEAIFSNVAAGGNKIISTAFLGLFGQQKQPARFDMLGDEESDIWNTRIGRVRSSSGSSSIATNETRIRTGGWHDAALEDVNGEDQYLTTSDVEAYDGDFGK